MRRALGWLVGTWVSYAALAACSGSTGVGTSTGASGGAGSHAASGQPNSGGDIMSALGGAGGRIDSVKPEAGAGTGGAAVGGVGATGGMPVSHAGAPTATAGEGGIPQGGDAGSATGGDGVLGGDGGAGGTPTQANTCGATTCLDSEVCIEPYNKPGTKTCYPIGHAGQCDPAKMPTGICAGYCDDKNPGCRKPYYQCSTMFADDGSPCPRCQSGSPDNSWSCGPE